MAPRLTIAVLGSGAMGSAAAWQLSRQGHDVTVFEQFERGHAHGSSHGDARIFRIAHPSAWWTSLAKRAHADWDDLQEQCGEALIRTVGGVDHGNPGLVGEVAASCRAANIPHEELSVAEASERWPGLRTDRAVVFHPAAGTTNAGATVLAQLRLAEAAGAEILENSPIEGLVLHDDRADVRVRGGSTSTFDRVILTAGAWTSRLLGLALDGVVELPTLHVTRELPVEYAVHPPGPQGGTDWPTVLHHDTGLTKTTGVGETTRGYALPTPDGRVKVGEHHCGPLTDPDHRGPIDAAALARVNEYASTWLPCLDVSTANPSPCLYTTTPSMDFIIDSVGPLAVAAGFSGHGFKFVPWVGRTLADLVQGGRGPERFRLARRR